MRIRLNARRLTAEGFGSAFGTPMSIHDPCVQRCIAHQRERAERDLGCPSESGRVDRRSQVMRYETTAVSWFPSFGAEGILEWGEGTDAPGVLNEDPPCSRRQMEPDHARPAQHEQRSEQNERQERKMEEEDEDG